MAAVSATMGLKDDITGAVVRLDLQQNLVRRARADDLITRLTDLEMS